MRLLALCALALAGCDVPVGETGASLGAGTFSDGSFGGRSYKLYTPAQVASPAPLVLMLHGCTQDPADFAAGTRMNAAADAGGFLVLYPDEPASIQPIKCWRWYDPAQQMRSAGEPADLVALVDQVAQTSAVAVDATRTFAAGISAGAAMAVILGATYPDRFAAITVSSGLEYGAAHDVSSGMQAQSSGGPDPVAQGRAAVLAMGSAKRRVRVLVVHGTNDSVVAPLNGDQVIAQWAEADDLADGSEDGNPSPQPTSTVDEQVPNGRAYTRAEHRDRSTGELVLEKITVQGMMHAWSGGSHDGSYTDPEGPDATRLAAAFFGLGATATDGGAVVDGAAPASGGAGRSGCTMAPARAGDGPATLAFALACAIVIARSRRRN